MLSEPLIGDIPGIGALPVRVIGISSNSQYIEAVPGVITCLLPDGVSPDPEYPGIRVVISKLKFSSLISTPGTGKVWVGNEKLPVVIPVISVFIVTAWSCWGL